MLFRIAAVASALLVTGCAEQSQISRMSAAIEVVIADQTLRASASVYDGSEPYVVQPADHLAVAVQGQAIELTYGESNEAFFGRPYYGTGPLVQPVAADEPVEMTLDRGADHGSIVGTAPMPLVLDAPATIASGAELVITWSPSSSDPMKWYAGSDQGVIAEDVGTVTFPPDAIPMPGSTLELQLQRFRSAVSVDGFAHGSVTVRRFATAEVVVTP